MIGNKTHRTELNCHMGLDLNDDSDSGPDPDPDSELTMNRSGKYPYQIVSILNLLTRKGLARGS
jgi:hypothetical protein